MHNLSRIIFSSGSVDGSWSASDTEADALEASRTSQLFSDYGGDDPFPLEESIAGTTTSDPPMDLNEPPKMNNFHTLDFSDAELEASGGYRSPAPTPLSYSNYGEDFDEEDHYEDEELMEIQIETLTGTTFRVRVSSKETTAGLKALLYRTEGKYI